MVLIFMYCKYNMYKRFMINMRYEYLKRPLRIEECFATKKFLDAYRIKNYKGNIYYPTDTKLNVYVKGYYSSNGSVRAVTNEKTVTSAKTATAYAYVPDGCAGVCSSGNKSSAKETVKSTEVATAKYPS